MPETAEIGLEYGRKSRNLPSSFFFFCESRHSNVFFKNILIVKIYRKLNKNIFNNFLIAESRRTHTNLFQKLPSPAPAPATAPEPESRNAPVLHSWIPSHIGYNDMRSSHCVQLEMQTPRSWLHLEHIPLNSSSCPSNFYPLLYNIFRILPTRPFCSRNKAK